MNSDWLAAHISDTARSVPKEIPPAGGYPEVDSATCTVSEAVISVPLVSVTTTLMVSSRVFLGIAW